MAKRELTKLDGKAVMEEAERDQQVYKLKASWRRFQIFAGILMCLLVIGLPFGIWFIVAANRSQVGIGKEGFAFRMFRTRTWAWRDIESFSVGTLNASGMGGGLVGLALASSVTARTEGLRGPLLMKLVDRKWPAQLPAHQIERSVAMAREMERRTGLTIFPPETAAK